MMHRRWTVGRKLAALSACGLLVAAIIGATAYVNVSTIADLIVARGQLMTFDASLRTLDTAQSDLLIAERDALLAFDDEAATVADREFAVAKATVTETFATVDGLNLPAELRPQVTAFKSDYLAWVDKVAAQMSVLNDMKPGNQAAVTAIDAERRRGAAIGDRIRAIRTDSARASDAASKALVSKTNSTKAVVVAVLTLGAVVIAAASIVVSRSVTRPLARMVGAMQALARRDLTVTVEDLGNDEIGDMATALNTGITAVRQTIGELAESSVTLAAAAAELNAVSDGLGQSASQTSAQTDRASSAAQQVASSAGSMSAATEQMTTSISEIAGQATRANQVASEAVRTAEETSAAVAELDRASAEIGEIVRVITSIAEQTNLLALNATIEAARAGDAGKGFAVVATEVKELAQETARATDDITQKIGAIQATTERAGESIARISQVIATINENQTTIAAAVEEQTATTAEISRNVVEVSTGSTHIADTLGDIAASASSTSTGATTTRESAGTLTQLATRVKDLVSQFSF